MTDEERKQQNQLMTDVFSSTSDTIPDDKYNWSSPEWAPYAIAYDTQEDQGWFEEYMKNISHGLSETYLACTIKGNDVPCEEMLSPVLTDTG
ncbi:hypothetical protein EB796_023804 [Bugula neritina]|uniref:Uncharacterized protein n=1 Tax=Bugula neritina TaxID=10212 RepID=A0A7J7IVF0_BUGNE|nr:hypothetical protein EB796_023804 [Bugula neritina]